MPAGRSRIYAPRIKGDLDLGLENSRIGADGERRWSEILTPGGLLPGRSEQDIYEASSTPNYRIGTRRMVDDRVFRYCRIVGADVDYKNICTKFIPTSAVATTVATTDVYRAVDGEYQMTLHLAGKIADQYAGGYLQVNDAAQIAVGRHYSRRILSNTGSATVNGDADAVVFTLEATLPFTSTDVATAVTVMENPWARLYYRTLHAGYSFWMFMGVCMPYVVVANDYIWLQTWGPCGIENVAYTFEGAGYFEHQAYILGDGSIQCVPEGGSVLRAGDEAAGHQVAGVMMADSYYSGTPVNEDHPFIFIMIAP